MGRTRDTDTDVQAVTKDNIRHFPKKAEIPMPSEMEIPDGQLWVKWKCLKCLRHGLFTLPKQGKGTLPFEITLGIHRTLTLSCKASDVTLTSDGGVFMVRLEQRSKRLNGHGQDRDPVR